uniref:SAP30-binding protein n=1 Tax=Plectus sambesii TaxID=2011161 RepID=A0A914V236_9BILA
MDSLAAYEDSDEGDSPVRRRPSTNSRPAAPPGANDDDDFWPENDEQSGAISGRQRRDTELPEAPTTSPSSTSSSTRRRPQSPEQDDEKWVADEKNKESSDFSDDEPPPPKRKQIYSPSPSSSAVPSPANVVLRRPIPANPSSQSLVSYGTADDDDDYNNKSRDEEEHFKEAEEEELVSEDDRKKSVSRHQDGEPEAPRVGQITDSPDGVAESGQENLDPHDYLEQALEQQDIGDKASGEKYDTPPQAGSTGENTPISGEGDDSPLWGAQANAQVTLPPAPTNPCDPALLAHFAKRFEMKSLGEDVNRKIQERKDFMNPSLYEILINHFEIDELGTNFPKDIFDPHSFSESDYYDRLAEAQKIAMDRLEKEKKHPGSVPKAPVAASSAAASAKSRATRFDPADMKKSRAS